MALEFGDDFCPSCEPIARIWHKGNDPIERRPIPIVDIDLQGVQRCQLAGQVSKYCTHSVSCVERATTNDNVMSI